MCFLEFGILRQNSLTNNIVCYKNKLTLLCKLHIFPGGALFRVIAVEECKQYTSIC